jgi:hypothetical protein
MRIAGEHAAQPAKIGGNLFQRHPLLPAHSTQIAPPFGLLSP